MQHSLRAVQQSLAARSINCGRIDPYPDGRSRFAVWPRGTTRAAAETTDDIETAYIMGLKMASRQEAPHRFC